MSKIIQHLAFTINALAFIILTFTFNVYQNVNLYQNRNQEEKKLGDGYVVPINWPPKPGKPEIRREFFSEKHLSKLTEKEKINIKYAINGTRLGWRDENLIPNSDEWRGLILNICVNEECSIRTTIGFRTGEKVHWTTSNPKVATIAFGGVITATGIGIATITATPYDGTKPAIIDVIVK